MHLPRALIAAMIALCPVAALSAESPARYTLPAVQAGIAPDPRVLPPGEGSAHGGYYVITALNWYAARIRPGNRIPDIQPAELRALAVAATQRECDLYIVEGGKPALQYVEPGTAPWPMAIREAAGGSRPYLAALDAMATAALGLGRRHETKPNQAVGQRVYRTIASLGQALRRWPGCPEDIDLGIRLESEALYHLEALYKRNNSVTKLILCQEYLSAVRRLAHWTDGAANRSQADVRNYGGRQRSRWIAGIAALAGLLICFTASMLLKKGPLVLRVGGTALSAGLLVIATIAFTEWTGRQQQLESAGPIETGLLDTDFPASRVLWPGTGKGHGGYYFMVALNHYHLRRLPLIKARGLSPIAIEPQISPEELRALKEGASQADCSLYLEEEGRPPLTFIGNPGQKPWPMSPAVNLMETRPYFASLRAMAQSALNYAKQVEATPVWASAEYVYMHIGKVGRCLRVHPGCLQDIELGLEIELNGLHYLEVFLKRHGFYRRLMDCEEYAASVKRLETAVRRKYAQLGNMEAAKWAVRHDEEPVWRIEAGFALISGIHMRPMSRVERRTCWAALKEMLHDPVKAVRAAGTNLMSMPDSEFIAPGSQPAGNSDGAGTPVTFITPNLDKRPRQSAGLGGIMAAFALIDSPLGGC